VLLFYPVINDIIHFDARTVVLIKYCFIYHNIVLCLVILFLCHIILICNNLIVLCNILMFVFTNSTMVMFLLLYYIVVLSIIIMLLFCSVGLHSYTAVLCLVMRVCNFLILSCIDMFSLLH